MACLLQARASLCKHFKVRLHGRRQAARLARDMLQSDLLRVNSVYMVGSCRARLLHIIHVSAVSEVGVLQEKSSRQPVPRGNYKFKLKMPPGLAAVTRLLRAACRRVNAPVVFLCFYFAARLSHRSRAACRAPCKSSFSCILMFLFCGGAVTPQLCISFKRSFIDALFAESVLKKKSRYVNQISLHISLCYIIFMVLGTSELWRNKTATRLWTEKKIPKNIVLWKGQGGTY